jgi:galactofuranose transport system substrate-binding protein
MTKVKLAIVSAGILMLVLVLMQYTGIFNKYLEKDEGIQFLIGVSLPNLTDPRMIYVYNQITTGISRYPSAAVQFYDASDDDIKQKLDAEKMLAQKVDLMIIYPNNGKFLADPIAKIYDSGIPVIIVDNPIESDQFTMFIYSDPYKTGKLAGEKVSDMLGDREGSVSEIRDENDVWRRKEEIRGFGDALREHARISLNSVVVKGGSRGAVEESLKGADPAILNADVIFAYSDDMAIGAWRAAAPKRTHARFMGFGGLPVKNEGLEAVNNGILDATILNPTGAPEAIAYALKILNGEKVPTRLELQPIDIAQNNVKEFLGK